MNFNRYNDFNNSNSYSNSYFNGSYYNNKPNYYYNNNFNKNYSHTTPRNNRRYNSVEQTNDLKNIVKILGNAMSYAESYAIMNGYNKPKKEFKYYDYFNASENTEKNLYFKKFNASIENVGNVFEYYAKRYNNPLPFPPSLPKSQIVERLNEYKRNVNQRDRKAYDNFINVIGYD